MATTAKLTKAQLKAAEVESNLIQTMLRTPKQLGDIRRNMGRSLDLLDNMQQTRCSVVEVKNMTNAKKRITMQRYANAAAKLQLAADEVQAAATTLARELTKAYQDAVKLYSGKKEAAKPTQPAKTVKPKTVAKTAKKVDSATPAPTGQAKKPAKTIAKTAPKPLVKAVPKPTVKSSKSVVATSDAKKQKALAKAVTQTGGKLAAKPVAKSSKPMKTAPKATTPANKEGLQGKTESDSTPLAGNTYSQLAVGNADASQKQAKKAVKKTTKPASEKTGK